MAERFSFALRSLVPLVLAPLHTVGEVQRLGIVQLSLDDQESLNRSDIHKCDSESNRHFDKWHFTPTPKLPLSVAWAFSSARLLYACHQNALWPACTPAILPHTQPCPRTFLSRAFFSPTLAQRRFQVCRLFFYLSRGTTLLLFLNASRCHLSIIKWCRPFFGTVAYRSAPFKLHYQADWPANGLFGVAHLKTSQWCAPASFEFPPSTSPS